MTFREFYDECVKRGGNESICVDLEVWSHQCMPSGRESVVTYKVWSGTRHYLGSTPEIALTAWDEDHNHPLAAVEIGELPAPPVPAPAEKERPS